MTFSVITLLLILSFSTTKFSSLKDKDEYSIMKAVKEDFYDPTDEFTTEDGFQVAAAVIDYSDSTSSSIEDPEIGSIKMYLKSWGVYDSDGKVTFKEVKTAFCSKKYLNDQDGTNSESKFFQTRIS